MSNTRSFCGINGCLMVLETLFSNGWICDQEQCISAAESVEESFRLRVVAVPNYDTSILGGGWNAICVEGGDDKLGGGYETFLQYILKDSSTKATRGTCKYKHFFVKSTS